MALDKSIKYGKEKRKGWFGSKSFDSTCRNHGSCSWCSGSRLFSYKKRKLAAKQREIEALEELVESGIPIDLPACGCGFKGGCWHRKRKRILRDSRKTDCICIE